MSSKITKRKFKNVSKSSRAGISFPIQRIKRFLRRGNYAPRIGVGAPLYLAAALEYLVAEILELANECATQNTKHRITPRHILFAIKNDEELDKMLQGTVIARAGVIPHINKVLLPKKTVKNDSESA